MIGTLENKNCEVVMYFEQDESKIQIYVRETVYNSVNIIIKDTYNSRMVINELKSIRLADLIIATETLKNSPFVEVSYIEKSDCYNFIGFYPYEGIVLVDKVKLQDFLEALKYIDNFLIERIKNS